MPAVDIGGEIEQVNLQYRLRSLLHGRPHPEARDPSQRRFRHACYLNREYAEERRPVVLDAYVRSRIAELPAQPVAAHHASAEMLPDRLVPEAHPEQRLARIGASGDQIEADPRLVGRTGSG